MQQSCDYFVRVQRAVCVSVDVLQKTEHQLHTTCTIDTEAHVDGAVCDVFHTITKSYANKGTRHSSGQTVVSHEAGIVNEVQNPTETFQKATIGVP